MEIREEFLDRADHSLTRGGAFFHQDTEDRVLGVVATVRETTDPPVLVAKLKEWL